MNVINDCVYHKFNGASLIFLVLYIDDTPIATNGMGLLYETKRFLSKSFEIKDVSEASFCIENPITLGSFTRYS